MNIILAYLFLSACASCPKYLCRQSGQVFANNTCVAFVGGNYFVQGCKQGTCNPAFGQTNSTCVQSAVRKLSSSPGIKCQNPQDCTSGVCYKGVCQGSQKGQSCINSYDCNPGLYCSSGFCVDLIPIGSSGCSTDFDCASRAGCDLGKCVKYFSIKNSEKVGECSPTNRNLLCSTGTCVNQGNQPICISGLVNTAKSPYKCQLGEKCVSKVDPISGYQDKRDCVCGVSKHGQAFCELFSGDGPAVEFLKILKEWVYSDYVKKCNTMERFEGDCVSAWWSKERYSKFVYYYYLYQYYPYVADSEKCVLEVYLPQYYSSYKDAEESSSSFSRFIYPVLILIVS